MHQTHLVQRPHGALGSVYFDAIAYEWFSAAERRMERNSSLALRMGEVILTVQWPD